MENGENNSEEELSITKFLLGGIEMLVIFERFPSLKSLGNIGVGKISPSLLNPITVSVCQKIE
jgi:hypothetical protein